MARQLAGPENGGAQPGVALHLLEVAAFLGRILGLQDSGGSTSFFHRPTGAWDGFRIRNLALAVQRAGANPKLSPLAQVLEMIPERAGWTVEERRAASRILQSKYASEESRYLKEMQRHPGLRAAILRAGQLSRHA